VRRLGRALSRSAAPGGAVARTHGFSTVSTPAFVRPLAPAGMERVSSLRPRGPAPSPRGTRAPERPPRSDGSVGAPSESGDAAARRAGREEGGERVGAERMSGRPTAATAGGGRGRPLRTN
jgi:hypothetical protein